MNELIGVFAVLVHVEDADPTQTTLTGIDMLLYGSTESARSPVHLIFSGETSGTESNPAKSANWAGG
ncbi:MAG TPA: hypothetical protein VHZ74_20640, partial [Bryobacteraceae bacterium]|nr:hypothetical protein [Bryobacteraceae bacterium]